MDQPLSPADSTLLALLDGAIDAEGKIVEALEKWGPLAGRDVLLLDADRGLRRAQLEGLGARVEELEAPSATSLAASLRERPPGSTDMVVAFWTGLGLGPVAKPTTLAPLSRLLRRDGRLVFIEAYGRDDTSNLFADPAREAHLLAASERRGQMLAAGFRVRVLHCWWTFADLEAMTAALTALFPATGAALAAGQHRPRLSFSVAVYHRTVERP